MEIQFLGWDRHKNGSVNPANEIPPLLRVRGMVLNATFNNIAVILWQTVLLA